MFKILIFVIEICLHTSVLALEGMTLASDIDLEQVEMPEVIEGIKSPTSNGMGYVFYTISPVGKAFLKHECLPGRIVIEIGAGFSNIPIEALKQGITQYIANDISKENLSILAKRVEQTIGAGFLERLYFLNCKAPTELPRVSAKYDAILADKVIHFMKPKEIKAFITWSRQALKKGGKVYLTAASPYSKIYQATLAQYLRNAKAGQEFPGHFTNITNIIDKDIRAQQYKQYKVPDEMVLFSRSDLVEFITNNHLEVVTSYALQLPTEFKNIWVEGDDEEGNVVGVIAVNR